MSKLFRRLVVVCLFMGVALGTVLPSLAQDDLPEVPRERTLISQGWDFYNTVPSPDNFNPYLGPLLHNRNNLHYTVYESLVYYDYFNGQLIPWLAESVQYNDDYTVVTVDLNETAAWSDGEPFTAEDVVFTINMLKANAPELQLSGSFNEWVADVTAVDDQTVEITLTKPGPRWVVDTFAAGQTARFVVVPQHIWEGQDAKTFANLDIEAGWPVGTGPYRLVRTGDDSVIFDRRESWWALDAGLVTALPAPERIIYVPATVEAMPQLFISDSIDMGRSLPIGAWEAARVQNPNLIAWSSEGPLWGGPDGCVYRLSFNHQRPPFDDVDIRRAINYAINRDQVVQIAYEGSTSSAVAPLSTFAGIELYTDQLQDVIDAAGVNTFDPAQTAAILEGKGYTRNADGVWANESGETLQLNIQVEVGNPAAPVLAEQLQAAGFDTVTEALQGAAFTDSARAGTFDSHLWVHCGSTYDPYLTFQNYHSNFAAAEGEQVSNVRAYTRYANPELDALLDQMQQMVPSPDNPEYMDLVRQALEIYLRDLPDITIAEERQVIPFSTTYWTNWPTADNPYTHAFIPWDGFALAVYNLQPRQ